MVYNRAACYEWLHPHVWSLQNWFRHRTQAAPHPHQVGSHMISSALCVLLNELPFLTWSFLALWRCRFCLFLTCMVNMVTCIRGTPWWKTKILFKLSKKWKGRELIELTKTKTKNVQSRGCNLILTTSFFPPVPDNKHINNIGYNKHLWQQWHCQTLFYCRVAENISIQCFITGNCICVCRNHL